MGRLFLMELEQDCFVCRVCKTHIAPTINCIFFQEEPTHVTVHRCINVQIGQTVEYIVEDVPFRSYGFADIYCVKCGDMLGSKFINADRKTDNGTAIVQLIMNKILWKHGNVIEGLETLISSHQQSD